MGEMNRIIICRHCSKPEYYGEMRWLSGFCGCRKCYKEKWEDENHERYVWDDLDRKPYPTMEDYERQESEINEISKNIARQNTNQDG